MQITSGVKYRHCKTHIIPTNNLSNTAFPIEPKINKHTSELDFHQQELTKTANNRNRLLLLELSDVNWSNHAFPLLNNVRGLKVSKGKGNNSKHIWKRSTIEFLKTI